MTEETTNNPNPVEPAAVPAKPQAVDATKVTTEELQAKCLDACKNVFDPEIPVNIFELGLIYDVAVDEKRDVKVTMTLTSPACPAAQELPLEVRGRIAVIPGVNDVDVDVVFDPPWSPAKMSEAAKVQLGFDL
ncbi:MAG: iron-sulfur cluster assembly protein [Phycisphaeraceae bacterium]